MEHVLMVEGEELCRAVELHLKILLIHFHSHFIGQSRSLGHL